MDPYMNAIVLSPKKSQRERMDWDEYYGSLTQQQFTYGDSVSVSSCTESSLSMSQRSKSTRTAAGSNNNVGPAVAIDEYDDIADSGLMPPSQHDHFYLNSEYNSNLVHEWDLFEDEVNNEENVDTNESSYGKRSRMRIKAIRLFHLFRSLGRRRQRPETPEAEEDDGVVDLLASNTDPFMYSDSKINKRGNSSARSTSSSSRDGSRDPNCCKIRYNEALFLLSLILSVVIAGLSIKYRGPIKHGILGWISTDNEIDPPLYCNIILVDISFEPGYGIDELLPNQFYECVPYLERYDTHGDYSYQIRQLPQELLDKHQSEIVKGAFRMKIYGASLDSENRVVQMKKGALFEPIVNDKVEATSSVSELTAIDGRQIKGRAHSTRQYQPKELLRDGNDAAIGEKSILVLRVSTKDSEPHFPANEIYSYLFDDHDISLRTQYEQCSFGQLHIEPTQHGVLDVAVDKSMKELGSSPSELVAAATKSAREALGLTESQSLQHVADFVFFCLPRGTGHWAAYSGVNHWRSVFNDQWCAYQSSNMHELGHGLGLFHANEGEYRYSDFSGYMGAGYSAVRWPLKCFNAQNHWSLGWFKDKSAVLNLSDGIQLYKIVSFIHYDKIDDFGDYGLFDSIVLLKVDDMYMQFNVNKGFNRDTGEKENQLTIVERTKGGTNLLAGLDKATNSLRWEDYNGGDQALIIEVCDLVMDSEDGIDYVVVSVGLEGSRCSEVEIIGDTGASGTTTDTRKNCDDSSHGWVFVDEDIGFGLTSSLEQCSWLREHPEMMDSFCSEGQTAYDMCPKTCGKCEDQCEDSKSAQFDVNGAQHDCEWLRSEPLLWEWACVPGSDAHLHCKETCNSCADLVPISNSEAVACDDSTTSSFWVDGIWGYQSCVWLKATPARQADLCSEGGAASLLCPETCGACDDSCEDLPGEFIDHANGNVTRTCAWLSLRPYFWEAYCVDGHDAYGLCQETCQRC